MKKSLSVNIASPCHENWAAMTPADHGRFCQACSKQVIDFTTMSDQQILDLLSGTSGNICGRLKSGQLERPLEPAAVPVKTKWWYALFMPLFLLWNRVAAQKNPEMMGKVAVHQPLVPAKPDSLVSQLLVGQLSADTTTPATLREIKGHITDEQGRPLPGATVEVKAWNKVVVTDTAGNYKVAARTAVDLVTVRVSYIGYESVSRDVVAGKRSGENFKFTRMSAVLMGDVVIVKVRRKKPKRLKQPDTLQVTKPANTQAALEIYPNPVYRGQQFSIRSKEADNYTVQVTNTNGMLLFSQAYTSGKNITQPVSVPVNWTPGMYYVQLVTETGKKAGTGKLLVR